MKHNSSDEEFRQLERKASTGDKSALDRLERLAKERRHPLVRKLVAKLKREKRDLSNTINEELLGLAERVELSRTWYHDRIRPGQSFSFGDVRPLERYQEPEPTDFFLPGLLSGGDYSSSTTLEQSNQRVFLREFGEVSGVFEMHGGHGSYGVAIRLNTFNDDLVETLRGLHNYPLLDEEDESELRTEREDEAWDGWARADFVGKIKDEFEIEDDLWESLKVVNDKVFELFRDASEKSNTYWEIESGGGAYISIDDVVKSIDGQMLEKHLGLTLQVRQDYDWTLEKDEFKEAVLERFGLEQRVLRDVSDEMLKALWLEADGRSGESGNDRVSAMAAELSQDDLKQFLGIDLEPGQNKLFNRGRVCQTNRKTLLYANGTDEFEELRLLERKLLSEPEPDLELVRRYTVAYLRRYPNQHDKLVRWLNKWETSKTTPELMVSRTASVLDMDDQNVGTPFYLGLALFWDFEYRRYLRDASTAMRRHVHNELLKAKLKPDDVSEAHEDLIRNLVDQRRRR